MTDQKTEHLKGMSGSGTVKQETPQGCATIDWPEFYLPPINQRNLPPALDFYSDESDDWENEDAV